jgi:mannose-1-phosphate guanylyltransferase
VPFAAALPRRVEEDDMRAHRGGSVKTAGVVLAAGAGTRLAPFTERTPKPLLPLLDCPLLLHLTGRLADAGVERIFVNLHHHADQIAALLDSAEVPVDVTHRREPTLTGPAGALAVFADELARFEEILVVSGDIVLGDELAGLLATHRAHGALFTVGVVRTFAARRFGVLELADDGRILRGREKPDVPDDEEHWISAGVYCLAPQLLGLIRSELRSTPSLDYTRHLVPRLLEEGCTVRSHRLTGYWSDVGTPAAYRAANIAAALGTVTGVQPRHASGHGPGVVVDATAALGQNVRLVAPVVIGAGAVVDDDCHVEDSVLLPGTHLAAHTTLIGGLVSGSAGENGHSGSGPS